MQLLCLSQGAMFSRRQEGGRSFWKLLAEQHWTTRVAPQGTTPSSPAWWGCHSMGAGLDLRRGGAPPVSDTPRCWRSARWTPESLSSPSRQNAGLRTDAKKKQWRKPDFEQTYKHYHDSLSWLDHDMFHSSSFSIWWSTTSTRLCSRLKPIHHIVSK